jgi:PAS domain S-box-containing protein
MTIRDIRPPEDIPALIDSGTATSDEPQAAGVWRHRKKNGKIILADMYASAIQFEGHSAQLAIAIDVTEQRKAEEAIRQSESRLRALVTSMEDIALEFDGDGTYIAIWTTKDELLPGKRSELIGRRMSDVHGEEVAERFVSAFRRVAESRLAETINYTMDVLEGSRQFLGRMNPIVNADGSCDRVCLLSRDVTEQKKMEAQFLRAQRVESIGTLASGVAHDLNNILAPILMGAATLRYNKMPAADEAILSTIETCAQRGADIVKQVLTFARGAEGERLLLQPARLVNDVARIAAETFPKTIAIRPRFSEGLWPIEGDPTQLHQVLLNLCVNARDAMAGGGMLTILAENFAVDEHYASMTLGAKAGPHVLFEVKDTGTGIPRQIIEKIFDPFFTTKELGHGTGLGLSTVIGIVKSHGGFVSVYSEIGRGTTFKVFLPAQMGAVEALKQNNEIVPARANGELLLIVDDEKPILQVAQALLEAHGYRVLTAGDATEALAIFALRKDEINLVLTDLAMPFMDGVALIRTLKKMKPNVRVIASTGRGDQEQRGEELAGLKVSACLNKPYNKNKLLTTLQDALRSQADE